MDIHLTIATEDDLDILIPFVRNYHDYEDIKISDNESLKALIKLLSDHNLGYIWLINRSQVTVGYIALCTGFSIEFGGFDAFVDEFFIDKAYRGQGIGSKVLQMVKKKSAELGINSIHLEVARSNEKAQALYRKLGFQSRDKYFLMSLDVCHKNN